MQVGDLDNQLLKGPIATIPNGGSVSNGVQLGGYDLVGLITPGIITAASLTLDGSYDGSTWFPILGTTGTQFAIITTQSINGIQLLQSTFTSALRPILPPFIRLVSGTDAAPVVVAQSQAYTTLIQPSIFRKP